MRIEICTIGDELLLGYTIDTNGAHLARELAAAGVSVVRRTSVGDGAEEIAGAVATPDTLARAWAKGINPRASLDRNDGHGFFQALGDTVVTGPTLTNVNDFRATLIDGPAPVGPP